jgi:hypothetical protein
MNPLFLVSAQDTHILLSALQETTSAVNQWIPFERALCTSTVTGAREVNSILDCVVDIGMPD